MMNVKEFQLYEKRLDNCLKMRDNFKEGEWGYKFWSETFSKCLHNMNLRLHSSAG